MLRSLIVVAATVPFVILADVRTRAATLTYTDGICEHRVTYDDKKVDGRQLKASFDYLAGPQNTVELPPSFETAEEVAAIDIPAYRQHCAEARRRLASPGLIALPGLDELRRRELEELDATCLRIEASLAAVRGDVAPARAYAAACTRYTDLLALSEQRLKAQWNDLVVDLCQASTARNICAGELQRRGEGPGSATRRRIAVLTRWIECATKTNDVADGRRQELLKELARRYRAKVTSCAQ